MLLFAVQLIDAPEKAARIATTPDVLGERLYTTGVTLHQFTSQVAAIGGFGLGGLVVAAIGTRPALLLNSLSFALSALVVMMRVRERPAWRTGRVMSLRYMSGGIQTITSDRRLRALLAFALLAAFSIAPEALAVPYADAVGGGTVAAGVLLCSIPAGSLLGMYLVNRLTAGTARLATLAAPACLPLVVSAFAPGVAVTAIAWALTGVLSAYQVIANAAFVRAVPPERRGQVVGFAGAALVAAQGIGVLFSGPLADLLGPPVAIAVYGLAGTVAALPLAASWRRHEATSSRSDQS
ncbi:hypothetical protein ACWEPN_07170 [Nonomuraea wenchangensis]